MTSFEQYLIDNGYIKFILNCETMRYELAKGHIISTMVNLDHRYFHKDDKILDKINQGKSVRTKDKEITYDDRKGEIQFGLHEVGKPPTLIHPRPNILTINIVDGFKRYRNASDTDDGMNILLSKIPNEEIFKTIYNPNICFVINMTNGKSDITTEIYNA